MDIKQKNFNLYVFLTTFSRNLIELFIPVILYKFGYSIKEVIIYYLFANVFSLILTFVCKFMSSKIGYKIFNLIAIVAFILMQMVLNNIYYGFTYLLLIAFLFALYRKFYWLSRRYYNLNIMSKKNIATTYSIISIINQIGVVVSSYIGSLFLDFLNIKVVTFISMIIFIIGIIPLRGIKVPKQEENFDLIDSLRLVPVRDLYLFGSYECLNVLKLLFALYLVIYVKNTYSTIGIFNLITNVSIMLFAYVYGKKINSKKNFLRLSIILTVIIYILKANTTSAFLVLISFLEGIFIKMYEISINKEFYALSKKYKYNNYNFVYEFILTSMRLCTMFILLFVNDFKLMIYITLFIIFIGFFIEFKTPKNNYYKKLKNSLF